MTSEAIILAGGFGTRLQSVVNDLPKPMAPVAGQPFLTFILDELALQGFSHAVLATGYMHDKVVEYFGQGYRASNGQLIDISYAREMEPLGTGGAILNGLQYCSGEWATVLNGDTLFRGVDYRHLGRLASEHQSLLSIALRKVDDTSRYGSVEIATDGQILHFAEKAQTHGPGYINGGIYSLSARLFEGIPLGKAFSFEKEILQQLYLDLPFYATPCEGYFIDIGIPEDYARAQNELQK